MTTVPTALERGGRFLADVQHRRRPQNHLRPVYDQFDPATGAVTRTPFPGNKIPSSRFDPLSASLLPDFWDPNSEGDNITHVNNFKVGYTETYNYYNFSDRVDYNINDKWKVYGRIGRYHTDDLAPNATPNKSKLYVPTGTSRGATQVSGDVNLDREPPHRRELPRRLAQGHRRLRIRQSLGSEGWGEIWPSNSWYKIYQDASPGVPVYFPNFNIGGVGFGGRGFYWDQKPEGMAYNAKISQQRGSHFLKAGIEHRRGYGVTFVGNTSNFYLPDGTDCRDLHRARTSSTTARASPRSCWARSTAPRR